MIPAHLKGHDFLRVNDWEAADLLTLLDVADRLKARQEQRVEHHYLPGPSSAGPASTWPRATCSSGGARPSRTRLASWRATSTAS